MKQSLSHAVRAQMRDAGVLFRESRNSLVPFTVVVLTGALVFRFLYTYPDSGLRPVFSEALYAAFALVFFDTMLPFPDQWVPSGSLLLHSGSGASRLG